MRTVYATLAVLLALGGCGGNPTQSANSVIALSETPLPNGGPLVILIGDSITQYWSGGAPAYPTEPITTLVPGSVDAGIAGETTQQMQQRFASDVLAKNPAVVVILGGTNDIRLEETPNVDAISAMAQAAATAGARVVISTVPPSELWLGSTFLTEAETTPAITRFNAQLRDLADAYGYAVADYYPVMVNADGSPDEALFLPDHIHPNATGYDAMWRVLRPVVLYVEGR